MKYTLTPKEELKTRYYAENRERILNRLLEKRRLNGPPQKRGRKLGSTYIQTRKRDYKLPPEKVYIYPLEIRKTKESDHSRYLKRKQWAVDLLGGKCNRCGYNKCLAALEFDHRDPKTKRWDIANLISRKWAEDVLKEELEKCELLCSNCHREKTVANKDHARGRSSRANNKVQVNFSPVEGDMPDVSSVTLPYVKEQLEDELSEEEFL